jgi:plastocyanin
MSDDLSNGHSFSFKFIGNGTYDYYDMDHMGDNNLTGTITIN